MILQYFFEGNQRDILIIATTHRIRLIQQHSTTMNDNRMRDDDAPQDNRNNRSSRRGGMEMPDDEPALDGYAR